MQRKQVWLAAKILLSGGLLLYLAYLVDWQRAWTAVQAANAWLLFAAPTMTAVALIIPSLRWQTVLRAGDIAFSLRQAYSGYLIGLFYSIFLPGAIGGDAVRVARCAAQTRGEIGAITAGVLLERAFGVAALLLIAAVALLAFPTQLGPLQAIEGLPVVIGVAIVAGLLGMGAVVLVGGRDFWQPRPQDGRLWRFVKTGVSTVAALNGRTLILLLLYSAGFQAVDIGVAALLAHALGIMIPPVAFLVIIPIVYVATVLPISLGGLGVREGTLAFLLALFGVNPSDAVTLSFLVYLTRVVVGVFGGIWQLLESILPNTAAYSSHLEQDLVDSP